MEERSTYSSRIYRSILPVFFLFKFTYYFVIYFILLFFFFFFVISDLGNQYLRRDKNCFTIQL